MQLWRKEFIRSNIGSADEVVFKRHECEWLLPQSVALKLAFNPRHLPVPYQSVVTFATIGGTYVQVWEVTRSDYHYATRVVFSSYK